MKGGVGAKSPARGSTPVPRPQPSDYRCSTQATSTEILRHGFWVTKLKFMANRSLQQT
jgi:hypothetical protein